ncbi:MAG: diacylglycerol kinase family protein [Coriobacteriaceae bacterium]|nr:diacylglycerol kinase family protein [Coriobacteriaceae bacterium]
MKILILHNQSSGYGDGAIYDFMRSISKPQNDITLRCFDKDHPRPDKLADAQEYDVVVASGGDGTIARVGYELRNTGIPLLPFPSGTSNALATNLFSPDEPHAIAKLLDDMRTLDFDMGEITFAGQTHGFFLVAGCGYDATIMKAAEENKQLLGPMAYFQAAFLNPNPQKSHFTLEVDGEPREADGLSVMVANFSKMQYDIALTHDNQPRDGMLDLIILKTDNAFGLIPTFMATILDRNGGYPDRGDTVEILSCKSLKVSAEPPLQVQYDGEPGNAATPFEARLLPLAARFVVSEACVEHYEK